DSQIFIGPSDTLHSFLDRSGLPDSSERVIGFYRPMGGIRYIGAIPTVFVLVEYRHERPEGTPSVVGGIIGIRYRIITAGFKQRCPARPVDGVFAGPVGNTGFDPILVGTDAFLSDAFGGKHMI